jgi:hypothetical protein
MSFADKLNQLTSNALIETKQKQAKFQDKFNEKRDEILKNLTDKYFLVVKEGCEQGASNGQSCQHINFIKEDFKANFSGFGGPKTVQLMWLNEMSNPNSPYLPIDKETGQTMNLSGLRYDIWNNGAFTTEFKWG